VLRVEDRGETKAVFTDDGKVHEAKALIIATGVKHRMLGLPGENELVGEGISFCAVCDGDFYSGQTVCVAGGGNSALQEAILLAGKCSKVIMLQDLPEFTGEKKLQEILFARENVEKRTGVKIIGLETENGELRGVTVEKREGGEKETVACDGLFVAIGLIPENEAFRELAALNSYGYFDSDEACTTKTPGVFVAGDCRSKNVRQLTTAAGDGATAALAACRFIDGQCQGLGYRG
jgi:thioredoxin reductase (NADPH)